MQHILHVCAREGVELCVFSWNSAFVPERVELLIYIHGYVFIRKKVELWLYSCMIGWTWANIYELYTALRTVATSQVSFALPRPLFPSLMTSLALPISVTARWMPTQGPHAHRQCWEVTC